MSGSKSNGGAGARRRATRAAALEKLAAESASASPPADDSRLALDRLAADLRALAALARSTALPPAGRVDDVERTAAQHLAELRARWAPSSGEGPPALSAPIALPAVALGADPGWREPDPAEPEAETSQLG